MGVKKIPNQTVVLSNGKTINLKDYTGKPLIIYFYPKASTPGCTQEGRDFDALIHKFRRQSATILGVSRDSQKAQANFKAKQKFRFELIADTEEKLCNAFDVIKEKNMYGRKVMGIVRSTFLFDQDGKLVKEWRGVKVKGHADEVLEAVKALSKT
ncbi:MAG: peroxiredoxin [bacterium]